VDASVEWRKNPDLFKQKVQKLIHKANKDLPPDVIIPHPETNPEERKKHVT
jgi:hypothetical protein